MADRSESASPGTTRPPPVEAIDFPAARVIGHDDRRTGQQRFERHEAEDLVLGRIDDDVGTRQQLEPVAALEQAGENRTRSSTPS